MAPILPHPRFTFCADIGGCTLLTVLLTSPKNVGIWKTQCASHTQHIIGTRSLVALKKKKQQGNRGERVMKSIRWSRMCEEDQRIKL